MPKKTSDSSPKRRAATTPNRSNTQITQSLAAISAQMGMLASGLTAALLRLDRIEARVAHEQPDPRIDPGPAIGSEVRRANPISNTYDYDHLAQFKDHP